MWRWALTLAAICTHSYIQLDLIAYGGYVFVPLVLNMVAGILFGSTVYYVVRRRRVF